MTTRSPPEERIGGRYRITEWVDSGGFANVWRAVDEEGGPDVAVKFPRWDGSNDESIVREKFGQAYEALSTFEDGIHPTSFVRFVTGRREDPPCIVTEFVAGGELATALSDPSVTPGVETMERYGLPVARALSFLHRNGHVYLDVKPENVLVRADAGTPVLVDFNTAEPVEESETLFHEDEYKAPEQLPGGPDRPSGPWSDVYGLGKLFAYLLTGRTTATGETPNGGVDVRRHDPDLPAAVAGVVGDATAADPGARPRTATDLVTAACGALGKNDSLAALTDDRNAVVCPVRVGDTVGRVPEDGPLPTVAVADPERYVSPVQFRLRWDDGWLLEDRSLNGTYLRTGDGWELLLSDEGYRRLQAENSDRTAGDKPYTAARLPAARTLSPVDPSYSITLRFDPRP